MAISAHLGSPGYTDHLVACSSSSFTFLNLEGFVSDGDGYLLSDSPLFLSASDSSLSLEDVPPFPSECKPIIFNNLTAVPVLASHRRTAHGSSSSYSAGNATTTVPTGSRLRTMLLEPICVSKWAATLSACAPPNHVPWLETDIMEKVDFVPAPWIAEGSIFPRGAFKAMFRHRRIRDSEPPSITLNDDEVPSPPDAGVVCSTTVDISLMDCESDQGTIDTIKLPVPTIMVSNSTAILPISLESSQSLAHDVPLAVRRGKKVPPPLTLSMIEVKKADNDDLDVYPGIPSPFLGSPSAPSPTFEFSANPTMFSMGLEAMCADLRSRCPDLNASPPITPDNSLGRWRKVPCSQPIIMPTATEDDDDDEWAFAKDLLDQYVSDRLSPPGRISPQAALIGNIEEVSGTADVDSFSWASSATFVSSVDSATPEQTPETAKQQRRKTVIIETPEYKPILPPAEDRPKEVKKLDSDKLDEHEPLPFESPSDTIFSCSQCRHSTPPQSRPASSSTLRPVRGILKEKKTVRFSIVHSTHKYPSHENASLISNNEPVSPISAILPVRRSVLHQGSPLRQSYSPPSDADKSDTSASPSAKEPRTSLPKHPAVRALARNTSRRGTLPSPQTPTPVLLADTWRAPLRSINMRQSLPAKRSSQAVSGMAYQVPPGARGGIAKQDIGRPKRLMKTVSTGTPVVRRGQDENTPLRTSRMPIPLRTILTKLKP